jgi:tetratricopeptide (TPR) repeat protein
MNKRRILYTFVIVLFAVALFGCKKAEEVTALPPLNKEIAEEECAVLIIPANAKVKRIDGKKRGLFKSWSPSSKAATLLVPAGEHTLIFEYSHPFDGWSAKKLNYTIAMDAEKMYILSVTLNEEIAGGVVSYAKNIATSFVRDKIVDIIPLISLLPASNPKGLIFQINEIDQAEFEQYPFFVETKITTGIRILGVLIGLLWFFIIVFLLRITGYVFLMGKFKNSHPITAFILAIGLAVAGILIINYNASGTLLLYLLASLLIGIGISYFDIGKASNKRGLAELEGKSKNTIVNAIETIENAAEYHDNIEEETLGKMKNNYERAVYHFTQAITLAPFNAIYFNNRGLAYYRLEDWGKAIADFTKAIQLKLQNETLNEMFKKNLADAQARVPNWSQEPITEEERRAEERAARNAAEQARYKRQWSIWLALRIILAVVFAGIGAYVIITYVFPGMYVKNDAGIYVQNEVKWLFIGMAVLGCTFGAVFGTVGGCVTAVLAGAVLGGLIGKAEDTGVSSIVLGVIVSGIVSGLSGLVAGFIFGAFYKGLKTMLKAQRKLEEQNAVKASGRVEAQRCQSPQLDTGGL